MKTKIHSHRNGTRVVPEDIVHGIDYTVYTSLPQVDKESLIEFKDIVKDSLEKSGWSGEYRLDTQSKITITSYYNEIGLCFQTGNVGRMYADLLKLQSLYIKGKITAGIMLVPLARTAKILGSNIANYERLVKELSIFGEVITMPIVVLGFDGEEA